MRRTNPLPPDRLSAREPGEASATFLAEASGSGAPVRSRVGKWGSWLFWLAAVAIAFASTVTIVRLLDHADGRRRTQIVLADIHVQVSKLRLAEVRAGADAESRGDFEATLEWAAGALPATANRLVALDPDGDAADRVREAVDQYRKNAAEHFRLFASGDRTAAEAWERKRSGPSFDLLQEATAQSGIFYSAQATRSLRRVRASAAVAIGSEALLIGLLAAFSTRSRNAAQRKLLEERAHQAARFEALVRNSADVIGVLDEDGALRYLSPSVERVLGYRPEDALGRSCLSFVAPQGHERTRKALQAAYQRPGEVLSLELPARHADRSLRWIEVSARNLLDDPDVGGIVLNFRDVTDSRALKNELRHRALHDPLTGIPNRELFGQQVDKSLARAHRAGVTAALLYLDLDGFKPINDTLGHEAGDELLIEVARRLQAVLRKGETAARLGGDEFALLLERAGRNEAVAVARRVLRALEAPFELTAGPASVGASVGIAVSDPRKQNAEEVLRQADVAMYVAKAKGKGRYQVFEAGLSVMATRRAPDSGDLERAFLMNEFFLQYQPVIQLDTGRIVGVEALVRWRFPDGNRILAPSEFLPLAEESGLILPLGRWVMREACRQVHGWQIEFPSDPPLLLSVNLSARQLADPGLPEDVRTVLEESGLEPSSLALEVSEEVLLQDPEGARARFRRLRSLGVLLAIDDFGFGLSSQAQLQDFSVDLVKIDKGFIDHISLGGNRSSLALRVIEQARRLSLQTVAEGVEQESELAQVVAAGCDLAQGFSLARPLDPTDLERLLLPSSDVQRLPAAAGSGASSA